MRKILIILLALAILAFPACNNGQDDVAPESSEGSLQAAFDGVLTQEESNGEFQTVDEGRFTFSVPAEYIESDVANVFSSSDGMYYIGINAVSSLGSQDEDSLYSSMLEVFNGSGTITDSSENLSDFVSSDGTECRYGYAIISMDDTSYSYIEIIMAPSKNILITTMCQALDEERLSAEEMSQLRNSIEFTVATGDELTANTLINGNDGSELVLNGDGTYNYYQAQGVHDDNYYSGSYEVYYGSAANEKLVAMQEYGYTEEELDTALKNSMDSYSLMSEDMGIILDDNAELALAETESYHVSLDSFHLLILTHENSVVGGVEEPLDNVVVPFLGYYIPELGGYDSLNLNTVSAQFWEVK